MRISTELQDQLVTCLLQDYEEQMPIGSHVDSKEMREAIEGIKKYYDLDKALKRPPRIFEMVVKSMVTFYAHAEPYEMFLVGHRDALAALGTEQLEKLSIRLKILAKEVEEDGK